MHETVILPSDINMLLEANLPYDMAEGLAGQCVEVEIFVAEDSDRDPEPWLLSGFSENHHNYTSTLEPKFYIYNDPWWREWRLPRRWFRNDIISTEYGFPFVEETYDELFFSEVVCLPSRWDLWEINIPWELAVALEKQMNDVSILHLPKEGTTIKLDSGDNDIWEKRYRIPCDWQRRRVRLPSASRLISQQVPNEIAEVYSERIVSIDYHPESRCCSPHYYHFRDYEGRTWPVHITDCTILGMGDWREYVA